MQNNLLVHIPHSSLNVPETLYKEAIIDRELLNDEKLFICDLFVDELCPNEANKIVFDYSRLYCDVERFADDEKEIMVKKGMGVVYTKATNGEIFLQPSKEYIDNIKNGIYKAHHERLDEECKEILNNYQTCYIVDFHSFSDKAVYEMFGIKDNPDICIGFDEGFYDEDILNFSKNYFEALGYSVKFNYPYSGSIIPNAYFNDDKGKVKSIMIEINKRIYLDENKCKNSKFNDFKNVIYRYFENLDQVIREKNI